MSEYVPAEPIPFYHVNYADIQNIDVLIAMFLVGLFFWINIAVVRTILKQQSNHYERIIKQLIKQIK